MSGFGTAEDVAAGWIAPEDADEVSLCAINAGAAVLGIDVMRIREVLGRTDGAVKQDAARHGAASGMQVRHHLRRVPLAPAYVAGVIPYRGDVLTTLSLRALLGEEPREGGCVVVLDDAETGERLGLMVDAVSGVVTVRREMREANPCTLGARSRALFDGVYKTPEGLIVRIDPRRLSPGELASSGLFGDPRSMGDSVCAR